MELIREKLKREVLDIFNIRLFCKKNYLGIKTTQQRIIIRRKSM